MPALATTPTAQTVPLGGVWRLGVVAEDNYSRPVSVTVSASLTDPAAGTTAPTFTALATGSYLAEPIVALPGRWVAVVTVSGATAETLTFVCNVLSTVTAEGLPTVEDVVSYLGDDADRWDVDDLAAALAAEADAQAAVCRVRAAYTNDLREALLRRVARNLAARAVPVTSFSSFEGGGTVSRVPFRDPEVHRLESPYKRRTVG